MVSYVLFKAVVSEHFMEYVEDYQGLEMEIRPSYNANQIVDGIYIFPHKFKEFSTTPFLYVNDMYEQYKACGDIRTVLQSAGETITNLLKKSIKIVDLDKSKDKIIMTLVNTKQNLEVLSEAPNREFNDLSIIYHLIVDFSDKGITSIIITNELAKLLNMDGVDLYNVAYENTKKMFPPTIISLSEKIKETLTKMGMPDMLAEVISMASSNGHEMYVVSNQMGFNGAISVVYEEVMEQLVKLIGDSFYLMPTSTNEMVAISAEENVNKLAFIVNESNILAPSTDEILSNQIYHYDKKSKKSSVATTSN